MWQEAHALPISYNNENKMQVLRRLPANLQLFSNAGTLRKLYIILHCFARFERQLQVHPELANSIWSYQCCPDFLMVLPNPVSLTSWTTIIISPVQCGPCSSDSHLHLSEPGLHHQHLLILCKWSCMRHRTNNLVKMDIPSLSIERHLRHPLPLSFHLTCQTRSGLHSPTTIIQ